MISEVSNNAGVVPALEIWKSIPGFSKYEASNLGNVRFLGVGSNKPRICKKHETPTSVGTYLRCSAVSDDFRYRSKEVHTLVCLAFRGLPPDDGLKYEVNHKDGNKHNNVPDNLEWMTRSENTLHAYQTGLRKNCIRVNVKDLEQDKETSYYSRYDFARAFNLSNSETHSVLFRHRDKPYLGRYAITVDRSQTKLAKLPNAVEAVAKDYVTSKLVIANDLARLSELTGVQEATIRYQLYHARTSLVAGYVFQRLAAGLIWPVHSKEEALAERKAYLDKGSSKPREGGVVVKNYLTGLITTYNNRKEAALATGVVYGTIQYLMELPELKFFRGWMFKYPTDPRPFPELDMELIEVAVRRKKPEYPLVRVTDLDSTTTKLYSSLTEFADQIGITIASVSQWCRQKPNVPYKGRYLFEKIDF